MALAAAPGAADARRPSTLRSFGSCDQLVAYARAHGADMVGTGWMPTATPVVAPQKTAATEAPSAAAPGAATTTPDFSTTNVQEEGVDEPDTVKADGTFVYAVANGVLHIIDARVAAPRLVATLALEPGGGQELLLHGTRLLVLQNGYSSAPVPIETGAGGGIATPRAATRIAYGAGYTRITEVDVSDPAAPAVLGTERVDGQYVSARLTGATARIVVSSPARALGEVPLAADTGAKAGTLAARRRAVRGARAALWRPRALVRTPHSRRAVLRPAVPCRAVRHPVRFGGVDMLTVLTVDLDKGLPAVDADALMTDADTVYGSPTRLYVATRAWLAPDQVDARGGPPPPGATTIAAFDVSAPDTTTYLGSGSVGGFVLDQFSLSERNGVLRVASTDEPVWWNGAQQGDPASRVTTLVLRDGALTRVGSVEGLGRGQRIYAVRFIDDIGYVVTFRQIDPLYTIGLSDPANPKVLGELELAGYSAYLHPIGNGLLLGVGQAAGADGRTQGTQLSLFDVSDPAHPSRVASAAADDGSHTDVEFDHHAFLYWPATRLAVLPEQFYGGDHPFTGAVGYRIDRTGIAEVGRVTHPGTTSGPPAISRSLVLGDRLLTLSDHGLLASALDSLAAGPFLPFADAPAEPPVGIAGTSRVARSLRGRPDRCSPTTRRRPRLSPPCRPGPSSPSWRPTPSWGSR